MNKKLVKHLEDRGIIKESQHGFRQKRSSTTLLANLYERIAREKAGAKNTLVTLILRDVKKAFDKLWHRGLIFKLMETGIETPLLRTLTNFITDRKAYIRVNKSKGNTFRIRSGVPQGDILSPTLYLLICNGYPTPTFNQQSRNFVKQYADDFTQVIISKFNTRILDHRHKEIHKNNIEEEIRKQNEFEKEWKISTNMQKFQIIHIGFQKTPDVRINGEIIPHSNTGKLLGLNFSFANFFTKQVQINRKNAEGALTSLYKFTYLKKQLKIRLYKTLVLPLITYPIIPLNAISKTQMKKLQVVQNKALKWINNEYWPLRCPFALRRAQNKIEPIADRIKRLAEGVWHKIIDEDSQFIRDTLQIPIPIPHAWFPSSYEHTFN